MSVNWERLDMKKKDIYCARLTLWETVFFVFVLLFFCTEAIFVGKLTCLFSCTLDCCCVNVQKYVFNWIFEKIFFPFHSHVALNYLRFLVVVTELLQKYPMFLFMLSLFESLDYSA